MKKWMISHAGYLKACCKLVSAMQPYIDYVMLCAEQPDARYNCISLAVDPTVKGLQITVSEAEEEEQSITLVGEDEAHLFYAVCDFKNKYIPFVKTQNNFFRPNNPKLFDTALPSYDYRTAPKIGQRGLWSWGHTIYDYRRFIDNMAEIKMNTLIIWNDFVPTNVDDVIAYAHENYIKVYLGYTWGWDQKKPETLSDEYINGIIESSLLLHREQYKNVTCDGIYFQTITEHKNAELSGRSVARVVADMVNTIGGEILKEQPDLKILFGLHATSVLTNLPDIATVDPRISIIWEDVGTFPWAYHAAMDDFDQTVEITKKIQDLRKEGGFGGVLKGYINLDWRTFKHHEGPCPIGITPRRHIEALERDRRSFERYYQAIWLKYAPKAQEMIRHFKYDSMMTVLVEDACFEEKLNFPTALYAELLWDYDREIGDLFYELSLNPDVDFA